MRVRSPMLSALALALFAGGLLAQQAVVWNDGGDPKAGRGNAFPFGSEGIRYQCLIDGNQLGNKPGWVNDILVAGDGADADVTYGDIEIRMGLTSATTLTTSWTTNNPNPKTVYRGPLRVQFRADRWRGIGLPDPYLYLPIPTTPNLCLEVIVWKVTDKGTTITAPNFYFPKASSTVPRAFLYQWTGNQTAAAQLGSGAQRIGLVWNDGNFSSGGTGCLGSNSLTPRIGAKPGTWPIAGQPFTVTLGDAVPQASAVLFVGLDRDRFAGLVPLPFDLAPLGGPGCTVWHDYLVALPAPIDMSGAASTQVLVPSGYGRLRLYCSWWCYDPKANNLLFTTSDFGKLLY